MELYISVQPFVFGTNASETARTNATTRKDSTGMFVLHFASQDFQNAAVIAELAQFARSVTPVGLARLPCMV